MARKRKVAPQMSLTTYQRLMIEAKAEYDQAMADKKALRLSTKNFLNFTLPNGKAK
jgi:hypothetical protein